QCKGDLSDCPVLPLNIRLPREVPAPCRNNRGILPRLKEEEPASTPAIGGIPMKRLACLILGAHVLAIAGLAQAHHSFSAPYDRDDPVAVDGTIARVVWANPHAHFYVDVVNEDGSVTNWDMELASPNMLIRNGWKRDSLKESDTVKVTAS